MKKFKIILASLTLVLCFNFAFAKKKDNICENVNKVDIYNLDEDDLIRIILMNQNMVAMPFQTREEMIQWLLQNNHLPLQLQNQNQNNVVHVNNLFPQNRPYRIPDDLKNYLNEKCGFGEERFTLLENLMENNFRNLNLENFTYEGTHNEVHYILTFEKNDNSPIGFRMNYSVVGRQVAEGYDEF